MQSGRLAHRMAVNLAGRLESASRRRFAENVSIKNISSLGARVITHRKWQPHDRVVLVEPGNDIYARAEVIYIQRLTDDEYAIGLQFRRPAD